MINCSSFEFLSQHILTLLDDYSNKPMIILVGGCSRTGKTVLVSKLTENIVKSGINIAVVNLDSWLISVEERKEDSSVLERYEIPSIISSVKKIQQGEAIYPPVYDAASRRRITDARVDSISIKSGIMIIEGVVALAIEELTKITTLGIFIDIPDEVRKQRLVDFYADVKHLGKKEYEKIIETREKEEVPFVKGTAVNADVIFNVMKL